MPWFVQPIKKKDVKKHNLSHNYQWILLNLCVITFQKPHELVLLFSLPPIPHINFFSILHLQIFNTNMHVSALY